MLSPLGGTLHLTRISYLVYSIEPRIVNVSRVTLNGTAQDITDTATERLTAQTVQFL